MFRDQDTINNAYENGLNLTNGSPLPGQLATPQNEPHSPISGLTQAKSLNRNTQRLPKASTGSKHSNPQSDKRYLGVRVKMPVRDMLRKIRIAKGLDPNVTQGSQGKASRVSGEKKRVTSSGDRRKRLNKQQASLEDLAIIVEVLEEDLKASEVSRHHQDENSVSPPYCPEWQGAPWELNLHCPRQGKLSPLPQNYSCPSELSSTGSPESYSSPSSSPPYSHSSVLTDSQGGYHSDEADERFSGPLSQAPCSPCSPEYQAPSPPESIVCSPQSLWEAGGEDQGPQELGHCRNGMSFFWFQLQREENVLSGISDKELLTADSSGRIPLHSMVNQGKGATVYSIAKRMAAMGQLDIKDAEGKTALHLAAQRNQHLMVSDLLLLGAGINERDKFGKTCLHLSAENGYVRVVEVLKSFMSNGMYVDVEARDINGLSALQCATLALNSTLRELERNGGPSEARFHTLRKEQLLDTLDCLLLMGQTPYIQYYESQTMWDAFSHESSSYADKVASVPQCKVIV